jgi:hypothetical protein
MTDQPKTPERPDEAEQGSQAGSRSDPARPEGGRTNAEASVDEDLGSQGTP